MKLFMSYEIICQKVRRRKVKQGQIIGYVGSTGVDGPTSYMKSLLMGKVNSQD